MNKQKILLIDDESELLDEVSDGLEVRGYDVVSTTSGREALKIIETQQPGIIICDISMPEMTGYEVLERVRAMPEPISTTPFLFLTAHSELDEEVRGRGFGADDYLAKPVDLTRLSAIVGSRLRQATRFEEAASKRIEAAQQRIAAAAQERIGSMERAVAELRPLLREASGANVQLISLMEGLADRAWTDLSAAVQERVKQAQEIVRKAGILAAIQPAPRQPSPTRTEVNIALQDAAHCAKSRMQSRGTGIEPGTGHILADPQSLRAVLGSFLVWASENVPAATVKARGDSTKLYLSLISDHRSPSEVMAAWLNSESQAEDPADSVAKYLSDAVESHGGNVNALSNPDEFGLEINFAPEKRS